MKSWLSFLSMATALLVASIIGYALARFQPRDSTALELASPLLLYRTTNCVPATASELKKFELVVETLDYFGRVADPMSIGATQTAARGIWRYNGSHERICPPDNFYKQLGEVIVKHPNLHWGHYLVDYEFELFAKLPNPNRRLIDEIAKAAFNDRPHAGKQLGYRRDLRPVARATLAAFGRAASTYSERAFNEMSAADSLGTSAAQIAITTGHPEALMRLEKIVRTELDRSSFSKAIPRYVKHRLYELAYALTLTGDAGRNHLAPFKEMLARQVESKAAYRGIVNVSPKYLCQILKTLTDNTGDSISSHPTCRDPKGLDDFY